MVSYQDMKKFKHKSFFLFSSLIAISLSLSIFSYFVFNQKIFRANVLGVSIESLTTQQAQEKLMQELVLPLNINIEIQNEKFNLDLAEIEAKINYQETVSDIYNQPRTGSVTERAKKVLAALHSPYQASPVVYYNQEKLDEYLSVLAGQVYIQPNYPNIDIQNGQLVVSQGEQGQELDIQTLKNKIINNLSLLSDKKIVITPTKTGVKLNQTIINNIYSKQELLKNKDLTLRYDDFEYALSLEQILELEFEVNGTQDGPFVTLLDELKSEIEQTAKNPVFVEENGKVEEFEASTQGIAINQAEFQKTLTSKVLGLAASSEPQELSISVTKTSPEISTQDVNNYGIKELIGQGESNYVGSSLERRHNVALAASKFDGVLISPGEVFSFIDTVGDISVFTGFKQSYVIMGNETVLGDGGGVCQVSTTLFRAALDAGLEIVERRPHSYRVAYYEQGFDPGIDATIYSPTVDLKIKNNTGNHILVQTKVINNNKLIFEFYGTDDGREVGLSKPVITEIIDAPEDLYIDDPTIPTGEVKQIDYRANGAKVYFDYKVVRDGETLFEKTFYSNYRPWQARFLRGI